MEFGETKKQKLRPERALKFSLDRVTTTDIPYSFISLAFSAKGKRTIGFKFISVMHLISIHELYPGIAI